MSVKKPLRIAAGVLFPVLRRPRDPLDHELPMELSEPLSEL